MKKIGIVGGTRWVATLHYYAEICRQSEARAARGKLPGKVPVPEMSIEALDWQRVLDLQGGESDEGSWRRFDAYHVAALDRLAASGVDFALISSNTAHDRLRAFAPATALPIVDMFEALAQCCARLGSKHVLILGPAATMTSSRLRQAFAEWGIEADCPFEAAARAATVALIDELEGRTSASAAELIRSLALRAFNQRFAGRPVVGLGCTELALAFPRHKSQAIFEVAGITYVNSTAAHIDAAVELAFSG